MTRELQEMRRATLDARADVEQHRRAITCRNGRRQRRTIHAGNHPERSVRGHHGRAGVPRAEQRGGLAARDEVGCDFDGGVRLAPECGGRRFGHVDHRTGFDETNLRPVDPGVPLDLRFNA